MIEIVNFKMGAAIIKFSAAVTNLNAQEILISHCRRDNMDYIHLIGSGSFKTNLF
jgi:hypothetical protein